MKTYYIILCSLICLISVTLAAPAGYIAGTLPIDDPPSTESGVFTVDSNGLLYFGHSSAKKDAKTGKGASSEIWTYAPSTGLFNQFYLSPVTEPSVNSASGIWIDDTTSPWTYYIADQEPSPGNPWTTGAVWIAVDNNSDGDIMDPVDTLELYTTDTSVLVYINRVIRDDVTGDVYVTNAEGIAGNPMVYRLSDDDSSGYIETGEMHAYFNLLNGSAFAGGLTFGQTTDVIYTHETTGVIYRLTDINDNGDVLDSGEAIEFATLPIAGATDIVMDPEGDLFVSASEWGTLTHGLYEVNTVGLPVVATLFEDLTATVGSTGTLAFDNGSTFEPNPVTDSATLYTNYTEISWADPAEILIYKGDIQGPVETPTMSIYGIIALILGVGILIYRKN